MLRATQLLLAGESPEAVLSQTPLPVRDRAAQVVDFNVSRGLTEVQARDIVGNPMGESNLDTDARNPGD